MVIVAPRFLLPRGFSAITIFPFIFVRKGVPVSEQLLNHERIHLRQQIELLVILFYLLYMIEYVVRFILLRNPLKAYRSISFEREAYANDGDQNYLATRKLWSSFRYM